MDESYLRRIAAARVQLAIAIACLVVVGATFAGLSAAANDETIAAALDRPREAYRRSTKEIFSHTGYYIDFQDRLLLDELPAADYSRGGVYLIGSSNVVWSTKLWELPAAEQSLIHNYSMGASNHGYHFQLLRYLIEQKQLLRAGGDKTLIVFGVSHHAAVRHDSHDAFIPKCWKRHGLYEYDRELGIRDVPMSHAERWTRTERIRIEGFLTKWQENLWGRFDRWRNDFPPSPERTLNPPKFIAFWRNELGPKWQDNLNVQVEQFEHMVDYLLARDVKVAVVLMPQGEWEHELPFAKFYAEKIRAICDARQITLRDYSEYLDKDDFADSTHFNLYGMEKFQPVFLDMAREHLRSTGALPPE